MPTIGESQELALLPAKAFSPQLSSKRDIRLESGRYRARLALSNADRAAAYPLRFVGFNLEMQGGLATGAGRS
jgi:hypothetical protein